MGSKPIFVVTHPRAVSTAFERVFMTRRDTLKCVHEPFGDAFYFSSERLGKRYEHDEKARIESGFSGTTYAAVFDRLDRDASKGKRLFIKDMAYYLMPPEGKPARVAPSLQAKKRGVGTNGVATANGSSPDGNSINGSSNGTNGTTTEIENPTVVPPDLLEKFHFTFLIRDPHYSIPSYYRCTISPLAEKTGFYDFDESESGYDELRRLFDYLREIHLIGPRVANGGAGKDGNVKQASNGANGVNGANGTNGTTPEGVEICLVDADELLDNPAGVVERYCKSVGYPYTPDMLTWETEEEQEVAKAAFAKWPGFHEDALNSSCLKARTHQKQAKTEEQFDQEWREKYGEKGARIIRSAVDKCMPDYLYLKQFALKA